MDEWADGEGNTLSADNPASFEYCMKEAFFTPLGELTVPENQRNFATKANLPTYPEKIAALKAQGAKLVLIFGIGRMCHIAFWEPHFAAEFDSDEEWKKQNYRLGAKLHPLTIEQNAITSFKSRTTLVPCRANTVGPGLLLQADILIGGADGALGRGMDWQGMSFLMTLHYGPSRWVTSSYIPTLPGKLFYLKELEGPLVPEVNGDQGGWSNETTNCTICKSEKPFIYKGNCYPNCTPGFYDERNTICKCFDKNN